jgi:glycosyltransferase involved in cell wall biosynthesis
LRIAFVDEDLSSRTGSRRFTCEIARQLHDLGHEVRIFTSKMDPKRCFSQYLSLPVEIISSRGSSQERDVHAPRRASRQRRGSSVLNMANYYVYGLRQTDFALKASEKIAKAGCEATLFHYHGGHWLPPIFYCLSGPRGAVYLNMVPPRPRQWALSFQESSLERRIADRLISLSPVGRFEDLSLRKVALFIAPSKYLLQLAEMHRVTGQKRAVVVPLGVNHSEFHPTGEEEPFALYLGRIHPHKSLELAIISMKKARPDCSLIIAGDIDERNLWYKDKLLGLAEKLKISDKFQLILHPPELQVVRLMQRCSVFLFPSTIDTFGLVVLEAMACGKPVVACNRGGVPEVVGDAGLLIEPDMMQWEKAVMKLLSDSEFRHKIGRKALQRSEIYSWKHTAGRLLEALDGFGA